MLIFKRDSFKGKKQACTVCNKEYESLNVISDEIEMKIYLCDSCKPSFIKVLENFKREGVVIEKHSAYK